MSLRLRSAPAHPLDLALASASVAIVRSADGVWLTPVTGAVAQALAFAGVHAVSDDVPPPPERAVLCIGRSLDRAPTAVYERVSLRAVGLGQATRRVLGPWWRPGRRERRAVCRAVLHGEDALVEWERRLWVMRSELAALRGLARPVMFDRDALEAARPGGVVLASRGAVTRWAFA